METPAQPTEAPRKARKVSPPGYICQRCGKQFIHRQSLRRHVREQHETKKYYKCKDCADEYFDRKKELETHLQSVHGMLYACKLCHQWYRSKKKAQPARHRCLVLGPRVHHQHQCDTCGKMFDRRKYLRQHERVHVSEKTYLCSCCDKAFKFFSGLRKHQKMKHGT
jgi:KRAB domain-containing zinc finger protein